MAIQTESRPDTQAIGVRPWVMLAMAALGFAVNFWAWALLSPLGTHFKLSLHLSSFQQALVVAVPVVVGALGRIPVGALTDRYGGRLMFPAISFLTIMPVLFLGELGYRSLGGTPGRRLLPRTRWHRVRRRRPVRQRLVPAATARARARPVRRGDGRHRDQRAHHGQADEGAQHPHAVPAHRGRPCRVRRRGRADPARLARPGPPDRVVRPPDVVGGAAARHLGAVRPVRRGLRRLRRVQRVPADLPEERLRPDPAGRVQPDGRLRPARGHRPPARWLAVGPHRADPGARGGVRRRDRLRAGPVDHALPGPDRHDRVPVAWPPRSAARPVPSSPWSPVGHRPTWSAR